MLGLIGVAVGTVQYSPFTKLRENGPNGTVCIGSPGMGKTYFVTNVCANELGSGTILMAIDPKDDLRNLLNLYPDIKIIDINDIQPGSLNPFTFLDPLDVNTLLSLTRMICGGLSEQQEVKVTPIISDFINMSKHELVTMADYADYLYSNREQTVQAVGTILKTNEYDGYGQLIFGEGDVLETKKESMIFSFKGMNLPKDGTEPQPDQRLNVAIIYMIAKKIRSMLVGNKKPTLLVVDEAHIAQASPVFKNLIVEFLILGRSLNIAVLLASQGISHFDDALSQMMATKIAFGSKAIEARKFVDLFIDDEASDVSLDKALIISKVGDLTTGEALIIDRKNRLGFMKVTSNFGSDMTTNPLTRKH